MNYIDNPVTKGKYTEQDLREYAFYRKNQEICAILKLLNDTSVTELAVGS